VVRLGRFAGLSLLLSGAAWYGAQGAEPGASDLAAQPAFRAEATEEIIVFTANQGFMSRIYLLRADGSVITYFHYDPYRFVDLEVVDNEVYASEAFAPRVLKVDLHTGDLEVIVDDWSLYYFYGLAFDGTYWYLDEWDLNRYEFDGTKVGTAPFDEEVMGAAWDGTHLYTLNHDQNRIKCWDVTAWPLLVAVPAHNLAPPTPECRGLWFDGEYFWTAESIEGTPGKIYRFDRDGTIVAEWPAPAFSGWGVCVVQAEPFRLTLDRSALSWNETPGAYAYDVVRGDLGTLRASSGDFTASVNRCLGENVPPTGLPNSDVPPPGRGFWYLVRGVSDAMNLTYDTGSPQQAAPRDEAIDAAPRACM
jgi:hypothetical protein